MTVAVKLQPHGDGRWALVKRSTERAIASILTRHWIGGASAVAQQQNRGVRWDFLAKKGVKATENEKRALSQSTLQKW